MGRRKQPARRIGNRKRWLSASSVAMATAMLHAAPAAAQTTNGVAVRAQAQYNAGTLTYTPGTPTPAGTATDVVRVNTTNTLINWVPYDAATGGGPISFLPDGNALFYIFDGTNYTVVNRILPADASRAVRFDGQVGSFTNNGGAIGGNIFFVSPGGIIVGGTGRFDVGSLVLTTSEVTQTVATSTTLAFAPVARADSKVTIEPWTATGAGDVSAQIQTLGTNSYVALVAPTVEMLGRVDAPGNVAYVAAEAATMTITGSLFDIVVNTGTTSSTGVVHGADATTSGSPYGGPDRRIQMVAVPKNDALTMLVAGSVGYRPASSAGIVGGNIVLTAGAPGGIAADLDIDEASFGRSVTATASGDIRITADGAGASVSVDNGQDALDFTGSAAGDISVVLFDGAGLDVSRNLSLTAGAGPTGGDVSFYADSNGVSAPSSANGISVGGDLTIVTAATGIDDFSVSGIGSNAVAGDVDILLDAAQLNVGGAFTIDTSARAGFGFAQAGGAAAGNVSIFVSGAGSAFNAGGELSIQARGDAAINSSGSGPSAGAVGSDSLGGDISLIFADGPTTFDGGISINTTAQASSGTDGGIAQDTSANPGGVTLIFADNVNTAAYLNVDSNAVGGFSFDGAGNHVGGTVFQGAFYLGLDNASLIFGDDVTISAQTAGRSGNSFAIPAHIVIQAINGSTLEFPFLDITTAHNNRESTAPGVSGTIGIFADASTIDLGLLNLTTTATVFSTVPASAQNNTAGYVLVDAANGATINASSPTIRTNVTEVTAASGAAAYTGGDVDLTADASTIAFSGTTTIDTSVAVPRGGDMTGLVSTGGAVLIGLSGETADFSFGTLSIDTRATGSLALNNFVGDGGNAAGGDVTIDLQGGSMGGGLITAQTGATGHIGGFQLAAPGDIAGTGGSASGGDISLIANGASFGSSTLSFTTSATGGDGGDGENSLGSGGAGAAGDATAGNITISALSGTFSVDGGVTTQAVGTGGLGGFGNGTAGGAGGAGTGGDIAITFGGAAVDISSDSFSLQSNGIGGFGGNGAFDSSSGVDGGAGGAGGDAAGGNSTFSLTGGSASVSSLTINSSATAGRGGTSSGSSGGPSADGGAGGNATGGSAIATFGIDSLTIGTMTLTTGASGGQGSYGASGGAGGFGAGGTSQLNFNNAAVGVYNLSLDSNGTGGTAGSAGGVGGTGGGGGYGAGGTSGIDVFGLAGAFSADFDIDVSSTGTGGNGTGGVSTFSGTGGDGGNGGEGSGGTINLTSRSGGSLTFTTIGEVDARGFGGSAGNGGDSYDGIGSIGGTGGAGGNGVGGTINIASSGGATLIYNPGSGTADLLAGAAGGLGGGGGNAGIGTFGQLGASGAQSGGSVGLTSSGAGSLLQFNGDLDADASAVGRDDTRVGSLGSDTTGGAITLDIAGGGAFDVTGNALLDAAALATLGRATIGNAAGGTVDVTMAGAASTLDVGGTLSIDVSAFEPISTSTVFAAGPGGNTTGGAVTFDLSGGTTTVGNDLLIDASAGNATPRSSSTAVAIAAPGTATGGSVDLAFTGGSHTFGQTTVDIAASAPGSTATSGIFDLLIDNAIVTIAEGGIPQSFTVNMPTFGDTVVIPRDPVAQITMQNGAQFTAQRLLLDIESNPGLVDTLIQSGSIGALFDNATVDSQVELQSQVFRRDFSFDNSSASALTGNIDVAVQNGASLNQGLETNLIAFGQLGDDGSSATTGNIGIAVTGASIQSGVVAVLQTNSEGTVTAANPANVARTGDFTLTMSGTSLINGDISVEHNPFSHDNLIGQGADAIAGSTTLNFLGGTFGNGRITVRSFVNTASGGPNAAGGSGFGGGVNILIDGADVQATDGIVAVTGATAGDGGVGGAAGNVLGGDITLEILSGSLTAAFVDLNSEAEFGFTAGGGGSAGGDAGDGGQAISGDIAILNDGSGVLSLGVVTLSTFAQGGYGGRPDGGYYGGAGGEAVGGDVTISNRGTGSFTAASIAIDARAQGGYGGNGGVGSYGFGGAGGRAEGGTILVANGAAMTVQDLTIVADATGGDAGGGADGFGGGIGGQGQGGAITFATSQTVAGLDTLSLSATGTGGLGAQSYGGYGFPGDGSQGGEGQGGSILIELTGMGTELSSVPVSSFLLDVTGTGGAGGEGQYAYYGGGNGGSGGIGTGGRLTLASRTGATLDLTGLTGSLSANGIGGAGGAGGDGPSFSSGSTSAPGDGGDGARGLGGAITLVGQGGEIVSGDIALTATGTGGTSGSGGSGAYGSYGAGGLSGGGAGGLVSIQALEGSPGIITLGAVTIDASGLGGGGDLTVPVTGGSIEITDASADPAGLITLGSLSATALGAIPPAEASFTMTAGSGPITVTNDVFVNVVGDIVFDFSGTGQLVVGGNAALIAGGDILLTHTGNAVGILSIDVGGNFDATAGGSFNAGAGTISNGSGNVSITAQDIVYDEIAALGSVTLNALTGSIGFTGTGAITAGSFVDLDAVQAISIGDASAETGFTIDAGSDVSFGEITNSGGDLAIDAGGNVSGVTATNDAPIGSPGGGRAIITTGGDVAVTNRLNSVNDSILVDAGGDVTTGEITAAGSISVTGGGALSLGNVMNALPGASAIIRGASVEIDRATIAQDLIVQTTTGDINGTGLFVVGGLLDLDSAGGITFASMEGNVVELDGPGAIAGGNITGGLTVTIGGTVVPSSVMLGGVAAFGGPAAISAGSITSSGISSFSSAVALTALTGDLTTGQLSAATDITATAAGNVNVTGADSVLATRITGSSIRIGPAVAGTLLRLNATGGSVTGTAFLDAGTLLDIDATQAVTLVDGNAATGIEIDAGTSVAFRNLVNSGGDLRVAAGANLSGNNAINNAPVGSAGLNRVILGAGGNLSLTGTARSIADGVFLSATGDLTVDAVDARLNAQALANGAVVVRTFDSGLSGVLQGTAVTVDSGTIGGSLSITATASDISGIGVIDVGQAIDLRAQGNIDVGSLTAATSFNAIAGGDIAFDFAGAAGGDLVFAAGGSVLGGDLEAGGLLSLTGALIAIGSANGTSVSLNSTSDILFDSLASPTAISVTATNGTIGANAGPGDIDSSGAVSLNARVIEIGNVTSGASVSANASSGDASFGTIDAANDITVTAAGTPSIVNAISGGNTTITGASVGFSSGTVGGNLRLNATAGDIDGSGTVSVGGGIDFDATGSVVFGALAAQGGSFAVDAGGAITFTEATSSDAITFNGGGAILGGDLDAVGAVGLSGASIAIGAASGASIGIGSQSDILFDSLTSAGSIILSATNGTIGANPGAGDIDSDGGISLVAQDIALGNVIAGGSFGALATVGDIVFGRLIVTGDIALTARAGFITVDHAEAGGDFTANSFTGFATGPNSLITGGDIVIGTGGPATLGNSSAGGLIDVTANHIDFITLTAGGTIDLLTLLRPSAPVGDGDIVGGDMTAGIGGSSIDAFGSIAVTGLLDIGGSLTVSADGSVALGTVNTGSTLTGDADGDFEFLSIDAAGNIAISAGGQVGTITGGSGDVATTGSTISITADTISLGNLAAGSAVDLAASGAASFGDATASATILVTAGSDISFGAITGRDVLLNGGGAVTGTSVVSPDSTGGVLDRVVVSTTGNVDIGVVQAIDVVEIGGAGVTLGTMSSDSGNVLGTGTVAIGTLTGGNHAVQGTTVSLGTVAIGAGAATVTATTGGIDVAGDLAAGTLTFDAAGDISLADGTVSGLFDADAGGAIGFGAITARDIQFTAGGAISGASAVSPGATGGVFDQVSLQAGGDVTVGAVQAVDLVDIDGANIVVGSLSSNSGNVLGTGTVAIDQLTGGDQTVQGTSVTLGSLAIGTAAATVTATTGNILVTGSLGAGALTFTAPGSVSFGDAIVGGLFDVDAGANIAFGDVTARDIQFTAGGAIAGGDAISPSSTGGVFDRVSLQAVGDVTVGAVQAVDLVDIDGASVAVTSLTSNSGNVLGTGTVTIGSVSGNGSQSIQGASIALGPVSIGGGTLAANATAGGITVGGPITAGALDLDATGNIGIGDATVAGLANFDSGSSITVGNLAARDIQLTAAGDIVGASLVSDNANAGLFDRVALDAGGDIVVTGLTQGTDSIAFTAGGAVDAGDFLSSGTVTIGAASIAIGDASAAGFALDSDSDILFGSLSSSSGVGLTAIAGRIGANDGPGDIVSAGNVTLTARDIALGDVTSGGSLAATATAGDASFGTLDAANAITVVAAGTPTIAHAISGGNTSISGASVAFSSGDIGGDLSLTATTGSIDGSGAVSVGGGITFTAAGDVGFGTLAAEGGDFTVSAGGSLAFTAGSASGGIEFSAGGAISGGSLTADGAITGTAGETLTLASANAGDALDLRAGSTLTLADAIGGTVGLRSATGAVIVTNDIASTFSGDGQQVIVSGAAVQVNDVNDLLFTLVQATNGDIDAVAAGDIGAVTAESVGDINLTSTGGDVRVTLAEAGKAAIVPAGAGGLIVPAGTQVGDPGPGDIAVLASGLAQGGFVASGNIGIDAGSTIDINGADAGGSIALQSGGTTRIFGIAAAGADIGIASGGDVRVTSSEASIEAGGDLNVQSGGTFDTQGFAYGTNVSIAAGDVVIGGTGRVGDAGQTQSVTFTGIGTVNFGGDAVASSFSLDGAEIGRIQNRGDLTIRALTGSQNNSASGIGTAAVDTSGPARIVVGDASVVAGSGGQIGLESNLTLDSQDRIDVIGELAIAGATGDNAIVLRAGDRIWLDTADGNLRVENGDGSPTGSILIRGSTFAAVSADALEEIDGASAADIDARLALNDGVTRDEGFLQAGTLHVRVDEAFLVQNSGEGDPTDLDTRRGFEVEILSIDTGEGSSPLIVINGTVGGATGIDALEAADAGTGLADGSTINGCLVANPVSCIPIVPPEEHELFFDDPARDLIEEEFDPVVELEGDLESQLIDLSPPEEFEDDPLIDDPVTGAGNEDFWVQPDCEPGPEDEGTCPPSGEGQPESRQDEEEMEPAE